MARPLRLSSLSLLALSLAISGCPNVAHITASPDAGADAGTDAGVSTLDISGAVGGDALPTGVSTRVLLLWDARRSGESFPLKFGEGTITDGRLSVRLDSPPPDLALVAGAVGVAHLIAVAPDAGVPDGELSIDDADALLASAIGGLNGLQVIYKVDETNRFPWVAALPLGLSCATSTLEGGPTFVSAACAQATTGMLQARTAQGALPFTEWQPPPGSLPRSPE